jgi:hypothetical protein
MSRFFAASSSSSEDEEITRKGSRFGTGSRFAFGDSEDEFSEEEEDESTEEGSEESSEGSEVESEAPVAEASKKNRFLFGSDSEDEDEDEGQRQVKSQKDKVTEEFDAILNSIDDAVEKGDWIAVNNGM